VVFNIVLGGSMVLLAFYLVTIRKESHELFGLLLIPATAMAALAATAAGPAANRFGARTVLVGGLAVMLAGLLVLRGLDLNTGRPAVFAATALIVVGGALLTTPEATIMMSSAPSELGGSISAVKSAVNEGGYSLGPALFALVGINLFLADSVRPLSHPRGAREALLTTHGGREAHLVNPEQAQLVIDQAPHNAVDMIHTLRSDHGRRADGGSSFWRSGPVKKPADTTGDPSWQAQARCGGRPYISVGCPSGSSLCRPTNARRPAARTPAFVSRSEAIEAVTMGSHADWLAHSDHSPMTVDLRV
jgi:hypothetical protein